MPQRGSDIWQTVSKQDRNQKFVSECVFSDLPFLLPFRGVAREETRGAMPPNRRLSGFFLRKTGFVGTSRSVLWASNMPKNALATGAPPRTRLGELATLHTPFFRLGRGHPNPIPTPAAPRFAPSALSFCAPNVKSWLRPCFHLAVQCSEARHLLLKCL